MESSSHAFIPYPREATPRLGVVFPQIRFSGTARDLHAFAQGVESAGFRHIVAYDHVLGASTETRPNWSGPYSSDDPFIEPFVLFTSMAAVAPTLEFASGVIILPQRQTALVAKQAANVDLLTNGRFRLGVGIGWNAVEYEGLNESFGDRARRFVEQIDVIRQLTSQDVVDLTGTWHRIDHAGIRPLGVQRPVPIWIGGSAEAAIRRGARIGDGFMLNGSTADVVLPSLEILKDEITRQERPYEAYGVEARVSIVNRDPDEWRRDLHRLREANVSHVTVVTISAAFPEFGEHLEHMVAAKRYWDEM